MKIAIVSDFHIGFEKFAEDAYNQAQAALLKAADMADMLLIPGDIFDNRAPKPEVLAQGINLFRDLSKREWKAKVVSYTGAKQLYSHIPVVAISGTHERRAQGAENPVDLLNLAGLLVDADDSTVIIEKGGERVSVSGLGGVSEELVRSALRSVNPQPIAGMFNIFMFHQSIYEFLPFSSDFLHLDELPNGFDLYVCGHIHNRIEGSVHGKPFLIPGSTVLTQLKDEETEAKGFYLFDTESTKYEFVSISTRPFKVINIKVTGKKNEDIVYELERKLDSVQVEAGGTKPIVKVSLEGTLSRGQKLSDINLAELAKKHENEMFVEISRSGVSEEDALVSIEELRKKEYENMSIKDYGISLLLESLKQSNYNLKVNPVEMFEILSSDGGKEKILKRASELLL
ncbi:MAG: metallophosphoesterase family protein [Candidatus Micrarchaeia archaeon]